MPNYSQQELPALCVFPGTEEPLVLWAGVIPHQPRTGTCPSLSWGFGRHQSGHQAPGALRTAHIPPAAFRVTSAMAQALLPRFWITFAPLGGIPRQGGGGGAEEAQLALLLPQRFLLQLQGLAAFPTHRHSAANSQIPSPACRLSSHCH